MKARRIRIALLVLTFACSRGRTPPGYQGIVELHRRTLGFDVAGRVREVRFERGQRVPAGEVVASLDDDLELPQVAAREADARAVDAQLELLQAGTRVEDVRAAQAQLRAAAAGEDTARDAAQRLRTLLRSNSVPPSQLEGAEGALRRAEAERQAAWERLQSLRRGARVQELRAARARADAAHASLALEKARLQRFSIRSPVSGVVLERHVEPGEIVQPGTPVATVGEPQRPFVDVFVPQQDLAGLRPGLHATVRTDAEAEPFTGAVESIGQETEFYPRFLFSEQERAALVVRVRIGLADPGERLHAGVPAFAVLHREAQR